MRAMGGISVAADGGLSLIEQAGTIIVPGWRGADSPVPERLIKALRRAHKRGARLLSFCSGVFVLAATGLLDGRRATTHWRYSERLARAYPDDPGGAGRALRRRGQRTHRGRERRRHRPQPAPDPARLGAAAANSVARRLVVPSHRDGGQAQFIEAPVPEAREGGRLGRVLERMRAGPAGDTTIAKLARTAGMSRRTFMRRFKASTGTTPGAWLANARIARARELLKYSAHDIEEIATAAGFGSAATCATTSAST